MAILMASTFVQETELPNKVRDALRNSTGFSSTEAAIKANLRVEYPFPVGPYGRLFRLDEDDDYLDSTYRTLW
jgi:hypothetical protein